MKTIRWTLTASLLALAWAAHGQTPLRVQAQEGSAPKFLDGEAATSGHCPDILAAMERVDKGLRFVVLAPGAPIKRMENDLKSARVDVLCGLLETPARLEMAHRSSTPVYRVEERLVGRREDTAPVASVQALANNQDTVVTQSGASYAADLRAQGVHVVETPGGSATALRAVESQRARFYYTNALTGAYYLRLEGLEAKLRLHPGVLKTTPSYLWAGRHLDDATVQRLDKALAALQRSGELERIYLRYARD